MTETNTSTPASMKQPRGLYTLFFTEMWERFSYYGLRAFLILFMTATIAEGGMGLDDATATAIFGIYLAAAYATSVPGGWIADHLIGAQRAVWYGGIIIMLGHFTLAIPMTETFYIGLIMVAVGTGLLKPNISALVGTLYPEGGARKDSGYTIFYMGINVGAALGPLVCAALAESDTFGWHYGFAAAGVGMFFGLLQFKLTSKYLGEAGLTASYERQEGYSSRYAWLGVGIGVGILLVVVMMAMTGFLVFDPLLLAQGTTVFLVSLGALYFIGIFMFGKLSSEERKRVFVIVVLVLGAAMFFSGFEQAGSSLTLFAERYTDRTMFGWEMPAGWFTSLNAIFILMLAPFFAALWINLAKRNLNPSTSTKFGLGLLQLGLGFLVMFGASWFVMNGDKVLPTWLFFTYLFHTTGELCLSPVGLSAVSKLAPKRFVSQMMGLWFLGISLGNLIAGLLAGRFDPNALEDMPGLYMQIVTMSVVVGILLILLAKPIKKMIKQED